MITHFNPNLFLGIFEPIFDVDSLFVDQHRRIRLQQDSTPVSIETHQITFKNLSVPVRLPQPQSEVQPQVKAHRKHLFSRVKPLFAVIGKKCLYFIDPKISIKKSFRKGNGTVDQPKFPYWKKLHVAKFKMNSAKGKYDIFNGEPFVYPGEPPKPITGPSAEVQARHLV